MSMAAASVMAMETDVYLVPWQRETHLVIFRYMIHVYANITLLE